MYTTGQLWCFFIFFAGLIGGTISLFFWLRRRLGLVPPAPFIPPAIISMITSPDPAALKIPEDYPYRAIPPLASSERALLAALQELNGSDYAVYPRVAAEACVIPVKEDPGYRERLRGRWFDFVICDKASGAVVSTLLLRPGGKANPADRDWIMTCQAAGLSPAFLDDQTEPTLLALRKALGWPEPL